MKTYSELMEDQAACIEKARAAVEEGSPVAAREWYEAAEAAADAAHATWPPAQPAPAFQGGNWLQQSQGQPAMCQYCHLPVGQCRGHTICAGDSTGTMP